MRLLVVTQKMDKRDPILGFFHKWVEEFAKKFESVIVICLEEGTHDLPANVRVLSLGKEEKRSRIRYILRFYKSIWQERNHYDAVFVHMNPEYVVLGGLFWLICHKRIALWYVHRQVNLKLRIAVGLSNTVFTSARESLGLTSSKIHYMGHGIEAQRFAAIPKVSLDSSTILHIGRITRIKHIEVIIESLKFLDSYKLVLVGEPITEEDRAYKSTLEDLVQKLGLENRVVWRGAMSNVEALTMAELTANAAPSGGMDKAVLESLAAGRPVFVANSAFEVVFGDYSPIFMYAFRDPMDLAAKIAAYERRSDQKMIIRALSRKVEEQYDTANLIERITDKLK